MAECKTVVTPWLTPWSYNEPFVLLNIYNLASLQDDFLSSTVYETLNKGTDFPHLSSRAVYPLTSMAECDTVVTPGPTPWSYHSLTLSHQYYAYIQIYSKSPLIYKASLTSDSDTWLWHGADLVLIEYYNIASKSEGSSNCQLSQWNLSIWQDQGSLTQNTYILQFIWPCLYKKKIKFIFT